MMITITNNGPSQIRSATLTISIPSFSAETGNYYYFYPIGFEMVSCTYVLVVYCCASIGK